MLFSDFSRLDLHRLPSPCFVVDEVAVERNLRILRGVADASGAKVLAALKAFSLWRLSSTETFEAAVSFGPYTGWRVWDGDVDGANKVHLLWLNDTGEISIWRLSPTGAIENTVNYGPY